MVEMKILGIDPGIARIGWGVIEATRGRDPKVITYDCIKTENDDVLGERLAYLYSTMRTILAAHHPDTVAVEDLFFSKNVTSALSVAHARGVILLAVSQRGIPVVSYSPQIIKQSICGTGRADKYQMQRMVARLLHLGNIPNSDDSADALAVAITHAHHHRFVEITA
jgi:crossover junction endodeoxyribonuclease RuvC